MINTIIIYIMLFFMVIGVIDKLIFKNKYGYGEEFERGINIMGPLALAILGLMCLAPVLGQVLEPVLAPLYQLFGGDPAMIAGTVLAIDTGGYTLATNMTTDIRIIHLSGVYLASMLGCTIISSIPIPLGIIEEEDKPAFSQGILAGMIAIPFGVFVSAMVDGIPLGFTFINLIPSLILALILALGLIFVPQGTIKAFGVFANFVAIVNILAIAVAIIQGLSDITIIPGMSPVGEQLGVIGTIAITLAGAYPMVHFITKVFAKPMQAVGKLMGINDVAVAGIIMTLASAFPMYDIVKDMDEKGKKVASAFCICACFAIGDHLGYIAANDTTAVFPMIVGKIFGGIVGILVVLLFEKLGHKENKKLSKAN